MTTTGSSLTADQNESLSASSYASSSISPTANALVLLAVYQVDTGTLTEPTGVSGCSLTWVKVAGLLMDSSFRRLTLYRAQGASPTAGAVTVTWDHSILRATICIDQFVAVDKTGANGANAVVQAVTNHASSGTPSVTLAAFGDSNNGTYGCVSGDTGGAGAGQFSVGSGFTQLAAISSTGGDELDTEWKTTNDTSVDWVSASGGWAAIAVEIKYASIDNTIVPAAASLTATGASAAIKNSVTATPIGLATTLSTPSLKDSLAPPAVALTAAGATPSLSSAATPTAIALALTSSTPSLKTTIIPAAIALLLGLATPDVQRIISGGTRKSIAVFNRIARSISRTAAPPTSRSTYQKPPGGSA